MFFKMVWEKLDAEVYIGSHSKKEILDGELTAPICGSGLQRPKVKRKRNRPTNSAGAI
jgi:hypothetical protein